MLGLRRALTNQDLHDVSIIRTQVRDFRNCVLNGSSHARHYPLLVPLPLPSLKSELYYALSNSWQEDLNPMVSFSQMANKLQLRFHSVSVSILCTHPVTTQNPRRIAIVDRPCFPCFAFALFALLSFCLDPNGNLCSAQYCLPNQYCTCASKKNGYLPLLLSDPVMITFPLSFYRISVITKLLFALLNEPILFSFTPFFY